VEFEIEVIDDRPATSISEDHPMVSAVVSAHREVLGETPVFGGVPGTTDGTILWRDARIPVVVYGPGGKWIAHQADEFVEVEDMTRHADVYVTAALNFLGS
jgi:succinyl-diaminopimelate desuccinylase